MPVLASRDMKMVMYVAFVVMDWKCRTDLCIFVLKFLEGTAKIYSISLNSRTWLLRLLRISSCD